MNKDPKNTRGAPSKHLMAFLTFLALLPLVYYIPPFVMQNISTDNLWVTVLSVGVIVPVITYIALPGLLMLIGLLQKRQRH